MTQFIATHSSSIVEDEYDASIVDASCALTIASGKLVAEINAAPNVAYAEKDVFGSGGFSGRAYFSFKLNQDAGQGTPTSGVTLFRALSTTGQELFSIKVGSTHNMYLFSPAGGLRDTAHTSADFGTLGSTEVRIDISALRGDASQGGYEVKLNGVSALTRTDFRNSTFNPFRYIWAGISEYTSGSSARKYYLDDVYASDATFLSDDFATVYLRLTPSAVEEYFEAATARRGLVYWTRLDVPLTEVFAYTDTGTVSLRLTPSAVEVYTGASIYYDEATVLFRLTPSGVDLGPTVDSGTVSVRLLPSADEEHITVPPPEVIPEPIIGYVPPPRHIQPWKILHKSGTTELGEVYPENLRFGTFLSKPGYVNYEIDMQHPLGRQEVTQAFYTDWELRRGTDVLKDLSGFHTEVQVSEDETTFIQVAGQTWLHYFEHLYWPFNSTDPLQYAYTAAATDLFTIVDAMLDTVLAQSDALSFTYSFGTSGQTTNFKITPGDQENIFSKIDQLSKLDPGFDIYVTPTREIMLYAPKKGIERNLVFEFHGVHRNIELVSFTDKGSKPVLKGFGSANSQRAGYVAATTGRRRYEEMKDYGEVTSQESLEALVTADQDRLEVANYQFSVRWTGRDEMDDLLDQVDIGDTVSVYGDTGYNFIDGEYRIVGIEGEVSNEADAIYVVTFDDGTLSL